MTREVVSNYVDWIGFLYDNGYTYGMKDNANYYNGCLYSHMLRGNLDYLRLANVTKVEAIYKQTRLAHAIETLLVIKDDIDVARGRDIRLLSA
jgi:hypothetical protein